MLINQAPLNLIIHDLGRVDYLPTWQNMQSFTHLRTEKTLDQIWVCEHNPVFTLGLAGDPAHLLRAGNIDLIQTDRGGQITYHGPGQLVIYPLLDLRRYGLKVREYVKLLEQVIIDTLAELGVLDAQRKPDAPGVYVGWDGVSNAYSPVLPDSQVSSAELQIPEQTPELAKIAALGIKVRKGCAYHGLSVNVHMDLSPFEQINPCGYAGLQTVDLFSTGVKISLGKVQVHLVKNLVNQLTLRLP